MTLIAINWATMCVTVFALGIRHGLDADHLAAIDSITRFNHGSHPRLARWSGALFAAGHSSIVIIVATTTGLAASVGAIPSWIHRFGSWISLSTLLVLGVINLFQVLGPTRVAGLRPVGILGRLLGRLTQTSNPLAVAFVGSLFALSFDTLSQALLFSATALKYPSNGSALVLGWLFALGMTLTDGLNGAGMAHLLTKADQQEVSAARAIGLGVGILSLTIAAVGALSLRSSRFNQVVEADGLSLGAVLIAMVIVGSLLFSRLHNQRTATAPAGRSETSPGV